MVTIYHVKAREQGRKAWREEGRREVRETTSLNVDRITGPPGPLGKG